MIKIYCATDDKFNTGSVPIKHRDRFGVAPTPDNLVWMTDQLLGEIPKLFPAGAIIAACLFREHGVAKSKQRCAYNLIIDLADPASIDHARTQLRQHLPNHHVYYCLNGLSTSGIARLSANRHAVPAKKEHSDMAVVRAYWTDLDAIGETDAEIEADQSRLDTLMQKLLESPCPPTTINHSGRGRQAIWMLQPSAYAHLDGPDSWVAHENINRAIALRFGGKPDQVCNVNRIMRWPPSFNIKPRGDGCVALAYQMAFTGHFVTPEEMQRAFPPAMSVTDTKSKPSAHKPKRFVAVDSDESERIASALALIEGEGQRRAAAIANVAELKAIEPILAERFETAVAADPHLKAIWNGDSMLAERFTSQRSSWDIALAQAMKLHGFNVVEYYLVARVFQHGRGVEGDCRHFSRSFERSDIDPHVLIHRLAHQDPVNATITLGEIFASGLLPRGVSKADIKKHADNWRAAIAKRGRQRDNGYIVAAEQSQDLATLLTDMADFISRFVALRPGYLEVAAVWPLTAYVVPALPAAPRLLITSPEAGSGKTTLLRVFRDLVPLGVISAAWSAAELSVEIDEGDIVPFIDEGELGLFNNEDFLQIFNGGYDRSGATRRKRGSRSGRVYDTSEVRRIFSPMGVALNLKDQYGMPIRIAKPQAERSLNFHLDKHYDRQGEEYPQFDGPPTDPAILPSGTALEIVAETRRVYLIWADLQALRARIRRWADDHLSEVGGAIGVARHYIRRDVGIDDAPPDLAPREYTNCAVIAGLADLARGHPLYDWPADARKALMKMFSSRVATSVDSLGTRLLWDILRLFSMRWCWPDDFAYAVPSASRGNKPLMPRPEPIDFPDGETLQVFVHYVLCDLLIEHFPDRPYKSGMSGRDRQLNPQTLRELLEPYRVRSHGNLWSRPKGLVKLLPEREPKSWNWTGYKIEEIAAACKHARLAHPEEADAEAESHFQSFQDGKALGGLGGPSISQEEL